MVGEVGWVGLITHRPQLRPHLVGINMDPGQLSSELIIIRLDPLSGLDPLSELSTFRFSID